jgi:2-methylcitrate dehydratase PrpD
MREVKLGWGWMSMAGTLAALSALRGFRGGHGILDGAQGFHVMAGSDRCDFDRMKEGLGTDWLVADNEPKIYPGIARNSPPHFAVAAIVEEHGVQPDEVRQVTVRGMQTSSVADFDPQSEVDAQFSLPYAIVTALLREPPGPQMYAKERLFDPKVRTLLGLVRLEHDPDADALFFDEQRLRYVVQIDLADGRRFVREIEFPRDRPQFGWTEVCAKFQGLCQGILPDRQVERAIELVDGLEDLENLEALVGTLISADS